MVPGGLGRWWVIKLDRRAILASVCQYHTVCLSGWSDILLVSLSICLSVSLLVCLSIRLYVCLSEFMNFAFL